jgi:hypothetical protein
MSKHKTDVIGSKDSNFLSDLSLEVNIRERKYNFILEGGPVGGGGSYLLTMSETMVFRTETRPRQEVSTSRETENETRREIKIQK